MPRVRFLWVPLLLAPAGVVFVGTRTAIDPIASAEQLDVVAHIPATISLPTAAIGITTPAKHVTVRVHTRHPVRHRVVRRSKVRIAHSPRPVYVVPRTVVAHVVAKTTAPHTQKPKPTPTPAPAPAPSPAPTPAEPTTPPPAEPPAEPTPTPAVPPTPAAVPPAPSVTPTDGGDDDQDSESNDARPGNGWGDQNHEHTGPPGYDGDHGRHGHD